MSDVLEASGLVGAILGGKYRVERLLGTGGMGMVLAARHVDLDQRVAIKLLLPEIATDAGAVARFYREAKAAVHIQSEHVARVFDVGRLPGGAPYMAMEFLEGADLGAWLSERGPLPLAQAVDFVLQACVAVAEAHKLGIIHRDLKPANLFCVKRTDGQLLIKVLDFGISKVTDAASGNAVLAMTKTTALLGSPLYMSPEQMSSSKHVDARTDIWALGTILFELVSGKPPFTGSSITELAIKVATEPAPSCRGARPEAPPQLDRAIACCLEKDPQRRFANVAELALALLPFAPASSRPLVERIAAITGITVPSSSYGVLPPSAAAVPPTPVTGTAPAVERLAPAAAGGGKSAAIWLFGAVLIAAVAALVIVTKRGEPASIDSTSFQKQAAAGQEAHATTAVNAPASVPVASASSVPVASSEPAEATRRGVPTSSSHPAPARRPAKAGSPVPASNRASKPSCDPPYYFDAQGNRLFKQECL